MFANKALVILYILGNKKQIQLTSLLNTGTTSIIFIGKTMAYTVCKVLEISFIKLVKSKSLKRFDNLLALLFTHIINLTLTVQNYTGKFAALFIIKLG